MDFFAGALYATASPVNITGSNSFVNNSADLEGGEKGRDGVIDGT